MCSQRALDMIENLKFGTLSSLIGAKKQLKKDGGNSSFF
jgi:hypothetical protein